MGTLLGATLLNRGVVGRFADRINEAFLATGDWLTNSFKSMADVVLALELCQKLAPSVVAFLSLDLALAGWARDTSWLYWLGLARPPLYSILAPNDPLPQSTLNLDNRQSRPVK